MEEFATEFVMTLSALADDIRTFSRLPRYTAGRPLVDETVIAETVNKCYGDLTITMIAHQGLHNLSTRLYPAGSAKTVLSTGASRRFVTLYTGSPMSQRMAISNLSSVQK